MENEQIIEQFKASILHIVQTMVDNLKPLGVENQISDGYHTFDELYEFRKMYNAALFNEWGSTITFIPSGNGFLGGVPKYDVHKSWRHHDGELCFGGGWFIVVAVLPTGQISNHYKAADWDLFHIPDVEKAKYEFDGHTPKDVLDRLFLLNTKNNHAKINQRK